VPRAWFKRGEQPYIYKMALTGLRKELRERYRQLNQEDLTLEENRRTALLRDLKEALNAKKAVPISKQELARSAK
jgi:hypothetical protein